MSIYSIPNFLVATYALILGLVVIRANPRAILNRLCFLLTIVSFIWLFSYGLMYSTHDINMVIRISKVGHAASVILVPIVYWFTLEVLGTFKKKIDRALAVISTTIALLAAVLTFFSTSYFAGISEHYWGYYPVGGFYMLMYTSWTFMVAARTLFLLNQASRIAAKELQHENYLKFKYHAVSLIIFIFAAIDYLPKFGLNIYPFGFVFVGAFSSLITYAIIRHRLLDVQIVIRRSFVYSALISLITILYLIIVLLSERFFKEYFGYASIVNGIVIASVIALTFNPVRTRIQNLIDRHFFMIDPERLAVENFKLKEAVEANDRMRSIATLAAGMAHEIKNPLTSIKTFAEYLPKKYDDPEFREKFSRIVVDEVGRVNNIVKQLLEFSKPSAPVLKPILIGDLLDQTLGLINNNMLRYQIEVAKELDMFAMVSGDRNQLKQAFLNLFLNSIQSMRDGGKLHVSAHSEQGGKTRISISDTGCGMTPDQAQHAFDPFFTTKEDGTGLGLAIVHSIITKHGGKIEVQSKIGEGTTISVFLKSRD